MKRPVDFIQDLKMLLSHAKLRQISDFEAKTIMIFRFFRYSDNTENLANLSTCEVQCFADEINI